MKLTEEEQSAKAFLETRQCLVEPYPTDHPDRKAPDFRVSTLNSDFFFFCEVKTIESKEHKGILHKTKFNIFVTKIHEAVSQFNAVNSNHFVPNVLLFLSKDMRINWHSFKEFLQGYISVKNQSGKEEIVVNLPKFSRSRISKEILDVDLLLFLYGNIPQFFFTQRDQIFTKKLALTFKIEWEHIQRLSIK